MVAQGKPEALINNPQSVTGQYLSGKKQIPVPKKRRAGNGKVITIKDAHRHNLQHVDVSLPLGTFIGIAGVSGSGKSSLIHGILAPELLRRLNKAHAKPQDVGGFEGMEHLDKAIVIDQSPIGRTPRSNPATYTGIFTDIRDLFAGTPEAKVRGYQPGRFSFNVKGGRCEECEGDGMKRIEMHFLPDVFVTCEACHGKRYNRETLEVTYKGKNISDALDMTVTEATTFFSAISTLKKKLQTLDDVGLGYLHLGQSANTLSGGEAQRVKLATELLRRSTGQTFYILDEPHDRFALRRTYATSGRAAAACGKKKYVLVIEHTLESLKWSTTSWISNLMAAAEAGTSLQQHSRTNAQRKKNSPGSTAKKLEKRNPFLKKKPPPFPLKRQKLFFCCGSRNSEYGPQGREEFQRQSLPREKKKSPPLFLGKDHKKRTPETSPHVGI